MDNKALIESLKNIVQPYVQDAEAFEQLSEDTRFMEDLKINSANLVDIILDVEDAFDIIIPDDAMDQMLTVKAAMDIIKEKVAVQ